MSLQILYISGNGFPTSATDPRGTFSLEHVKALRAQGAEVISVDMQADDFGEDRVEGLPIRRIPQFRPILRAGNIGRVKQYLAARRSLRQIPHDVVIFSFSYLKYLPLVYSLKRPGVTVLMIPHGGDVMPGGAMLRFFKRHLFAMVDIITPVSDYTETLLSCLIDRKDVDNKKIVTIYNGVDREKLKTDRDPALLRNTLNLPTDAFVILSVGNLVKRKGIDVLIEAVGQLLADGRNIHHVIIGGGVEKERLVDIAHRTGRPDNFHFISSVSREELSDFYVMANLFALLSTTRWDERRTEGFGIVYAEAMALGTPVIGGRGSGTSTPIKDGFTGVLVDPYLPDLPRRVANVTARFMDDPEFYARLSENARAHVAETFSWETNARATLDAIARHRSDALKTSLRDSPRDDEGSL